MESSSWPARARSQARRATSPAVFEEAHATLFLARSLIWRRGRQQRSRGSSRNGAASRGETVSRRSRRLSPRPTGLRREVDAGRFRLTFCTGRRGDITGRRCRSPRGHRWLAEHSERSGGARLQPATLESATPAARPVLRASNFRSFRTSLLLWPSNPRRCVSPAARPPVRSSLPGTASRLERRAHVR